MIGELFLAAIGGILAGWILYKATSKAEARRIRKNAPKRIMEQKEIFIADGQVVPILPGDQGTKKKKIIEERLKKEKEHVQKIEEQKKLQEGAMKKKEIKKKITKKKGS